MHSLDVMPIGEGDEFNNAGAVVYIDAEARRRHLVVLGGSGSGKSTMLRNMIAWDIDSGEGVSVIDPHGQLVEDTIGHHIPRRRTNDVIYLNPKDPAVAVAINLLDCPRPELRGLVVANVLAVFKRYWPDAFAAGARMEDIIRNSLFALVEQPEPVSIVAVPKLLTDSGYRAEVLRAVTNAGVLDFFHSQFNTWPPAFRAEAISSVLNKFRAFTTDPMLRAIVGQARSSFSFREALDARQIILCDLAEGLIGRDNARLLGSLIVVQEQLACASRADIKEEERVPHFLYAEEAPTFVGDFGSIFTGSRKFALYLTLVAQSAEMLTDEDISAMFNSAGGLISFRVSGADAERLKKEFGQVSPGVALGDLHELKDRRAYVRRLICDEHGCEPGQPERIATYAPLKSRNVEWRSAIERASNHVYARPRSIVDREIGRFIRKRYPQPEESTKAKRKRKK